VDVEVFEGVRFECRTMESMCCNVKDLYIKYIGCRFVSFPSSLDLCSPGKGKKGEVVPVLN
jgi:hypothetical protein